MNRRSYGSDAAGSQGSVVLYVLMFLVASALIVGGVIAYERGVRKRRQTEASAEPNIEYSTSNKTNLGDDYYRERGFTPNKPDPEKTTQPEVTPATTHVEEPTYKFVGDARYKVYHRPDCRHVGLMDKDRRTLLESAAEAWSRGFIPCKVCKPPLPRVARAEEPEPEPPPRKTTEPTKEPTQPRPQPKPPVVDPTVPAKAEAPVDLKIEDVDVPFQFKVVKSVPDVYKGVVQLDITVDTQRPLKRDEVLMLARKLVAAAIKERKLNAVSIFMRTDPALRRTIKWVCTAEWAPYGSLSRATEVNTGDYRHHKFRIYQMGFFTP
jgi:hypothetical protein